MRRIKFILALISVFYVSLIFPLAAQDSDSFDLQEHYNAGLHFYKMRQYDAAVDEFLKVAKEDPDYKKVIKYLKKAEMKRYGTALDEKLKKPEGEKPAPQEEITRQQQEADVHKEAKAEEKGPYSQEEIKRELDKPLTYLINVGDVVEISVWRNEDLQKDVIIRPDGLLSFPLVGDVQAAGLSLVELDEIITKKLTQYVRSPVVSVAVKRFGGTKVMVLGEIRAPGVYSPSGQGSVVEVLALAGGFTEDATRTSVMVIRGGLAEPKPIRLNLARVFAKADLSQNIALQPNDIVYVPKRFVANVNYWIKQVTPTLSNMLLGTSVAKDFGALDSNR